MSDQLNDTSQPNPVPEAAASATPTLLDYERKPWSFNDPRWIVVGNVLIIILGIAILACIAIGFF